MTENILWRLFSHNNWSNLQLIEACSALSDEQLDAKPSSASTWNICITLIHLVECQQGYLSLLTLPPEAREKAELSFAELKESAKASGEGLLALARDAQGTWLDARLRTMDGYFVEPWVVMNQAVHHATEHRRQIGDMLRALGVTPPRLDGWSFGEASGALVPTATDPNGD